MLELQDRFIRDMQLCNFSESSIEAYTRAVCQLAEHFNNSPDLITKKELKEYFLYNRNIRKYFALLLLSS